MKCPWCGNQYLKSDKGDYYCPDCWKWILDDEKNYKQQKWKEDEERFGLK